MVAAAVITLIGVSVIARPEPGPCRDTPLVVGAPICAAPQADRGLVFGAAGAGAALTWFVSGAVERRSLRLRPPGPFRRS